MTYQQAVARVDSRLRFGIKAGLDNITALLHKLEDPHKKLRVVHVAGTNGKGTTCTLLASVLHKAGYRTGLFTSPYVIDFRERFIINGTMIEPEGVIQLVKKVEPAVLELEQEGVYVTEFEMITAMGFLWFYEQQCDIVVLEVGLGGRFDATNVIACPEAAVVASISLDHTAILGDTVEQIAFEKAGIFKPGTTAVLYPKEPEGAQTVLENACREKGIPCVTARERGCNRTRYGYQRYAPALERAGTAFHGIYRGTPAVKCRDGISDHRGAAGKRLAFAG